MLKVLMTGFSLGLKLRWKIFQWGTLYLWNNMSIAILFFCDNVSIFYFSPSNLNDQFKYILWIFQIIFPWYFRKFLKQIVSSPSYYVWGTLVSVQIFDFRFLADLHVLGSGESKKYKISMMSGCSLVSMLVGLFVSLWRRYRLNKSS